ncbi:MAG TPA: MBL fold metallo-hydrolase [Bacteroidales bacterium]|nr:MBL fold metallo-hydrolase [Bacteroidales bacterium]
MKIHRKVFSPIQVNTYILEDDSGKGAIIDCGCYDESEFNELQKLLEAECIEPVLLLNTHMHLDHIFGNRFMLEKYGLKTHSSSGEEMNRVSSAEHAVLFGLSMEQPPETEGFLADGQIISFGNINLDTIFVPGHTAGSVAFYHEISNSVFTGDALFAGSIGRTDLPGGDYDKLIKSIRSRLLILPDNTRVFPGHGPESTIGFEEANNPYLV